MDEMKSAYKRVLQDLLKDMQRRMVEGGDTPVDVSEVVDEQVEGAMPEIESAEAENGEAECGECEMSPCRCEKPLPAKKGVTITLAAIRKAPMKKPEPMPQPMPQKSVSVVEQVLGSKSKKRK